jgi:hypothetical protein
MDEFISQSSINTGAGKLLYPTGLWVGLVAVSCYLLRALPKATIVLSITHSHSHLPILTITFLP